MNKFILALSALLVGQTAMAAGFEKSIPFGGEASGTAGIGSPYMQGSQALYYNPAGLAGDKVGAQDVSVNVSPTVGKTKAPLSANAAQTDAKDKTVFPFGIMYGNTLSEKLGVGAGVYISGGNQAEFNNISGTQLNAKTDLTIMEAALGAGYKVTPDLKLGLAWRMVMVNGGLSSVQGANELKFTDLKDTNYMGLKFGAQYKLSESTNLGFAYRSETTFKAKGKFSAHNNSGAVVVPETNGELRTLFPASWTFGIAHKCNEMWKFMGELVFTEYSKVKNLDVQNDTTGSSLLKMEWKDQINVRLAGEYALSWPIRFGYVWTSKVTDSDNALPTLTPPGDAHTLTLGTGQAFGDFRVDGGLEYTMASGARTGYQAKNELTAYALHLGAAYSF